MKTSLEGNLSTDLKVDKVANITRGPELIQQGIIQFVILELTELVECSVVWFYTSRHLQSTRAPLCELMKNLKG